MAFNTWVLVPPTVVMGPAPVFPVKLNVASPPVVFLMMVMVEFLVLLNVQVVVCPGIMVTLLALPDPGVNVLSQVTEPKFHPA